MELDLLKGKLDIENVILPQLGITVSKRSGREYLCHCPDVLGNHKNGDRNPSFTFNEDKLLYNCFVCGGGSLIRLVQDCLLLDSSAAEQWLEERIENVESVSEFTDEIERILATHKAQLEPMPEYPKELLFQYEGFHPYLSERGVSREVAVELQIGFDPDHCGIVFPVFFRRKLVGTQTRHLAIDKGGNFLCPDGCFQSKVTAQYRGTAVPKYKNTPNFPRKTTLYNYDNVVTNFSSVIVVESPMSVAYLKTNGIHNVVASFGSGLNPQQAQLLFPFYDGIYMWIDNDKAGDKTLESALLILEAFVPMFIIPVVPGDKSDPADVHPNELSSYLAAAYPSLLLPLEGLKVGVH